MMQTTRGNRGRGRVQAPQRNVQARVTNLNHQLRGTKFTPPPQPRAYTAIPWNSLTLEFERVVEDSATSELELIVSEVRTAIQAKVGSSPKFKAVRYESWCTADGLSYPTLKAEFFDIVDQDPINPEARSQQSDRGTLNMPAKIGFLPPMTDQKRVLSGTDDAVKLLKISTGGATTGMVLLLRVHVLWKYVNATF